MKITKKFMDWYQGNNDVEREPPRSGPKRVWYIIVNYFGKLVVINLVFLLCCIPVATIPAALSALNYYLGKIFRVGYGMELSDYWKEFKGGILRQLPLGLLCGALAFYSYYLLSLAGNFEGDRSGIVAGIGLAVGIIAILLISWIFVLTSMLDLPRKHILKNAVILMMAEWKRSIFVVLETVLFCVLVLGLVPYSILPVLILGFSVQQLTVCAALIPAVQKRIIDPYESQGTACA